MQKKLLMSIILVSLVFFSCWDFSLPNKIELEVEGYVDLPVRITASDWGSVLTKTLREAFSGTMDNVGVEVYNVNDGQDVQAFLVYFPIKISDSLNPKDYLDDINLTKDSPALTINKEVKVPSFDDFTIECPVNYPLLITPFPSSTTTVNYPVGIPFSFSKEFDLESSISDAFLHASIKKGDFDITLVLSEGNVTLANENELTKEYDITISQCPDSSSPGSSSVKPYYGLSYSASDSVLPSLDNQHINKKTIKINGTVTLKSNDGNFTVNKKSGAGNELKGQLNIKMNISEYKELDLDFNKVNVNIDNPEPVSLEEAANYLNYIKFDKCDDDGKNAGIGIKIDFKDSSNEIINGLAMSIKCDDLGLNYDAEPLHAGNNVFGNKALQKLELAGYKNNAKKLKFTINLLPSGDNKNVLHLANLKTENTLKINGEAELFQHWTEAEVQINEAFEEQFPDADEDPVNLSLLNDYFKGFTFSDNDIEAAAYFSGPDKILGPLKPNLTIEAKSSALKSPSVMIDGRITFEQNHIVIAGNSEYLDAKGAYKKKGLPDKGKNLNNFVDVINARPDDLVFNFKMDVSGTQTITPAMFDDNNEAASNDISVTIMLLIHLRLTAGEGGGQITFPDIFKDQKDLLGRNTLEENSKFTSLNVDYINCTVDFISGFFPGAKLFIEKKSGDKSKLLFPDGILLDGSKIALTIRNKEFEFIKSHLIDPDLRLEFEKGRTITVPKNIGVVTVKVEAKGKHTIELGF